MEVELATHLKFGQMLYGHATTICKKNILWVLKFKFIKIYKYIFSDKIIQGVIEMKSLAFFNVM